MHNLVKLGLDDTATDVTERSLDETTHLMIHRFANLGLSDTATDVAETESLTDVSQRRPKNTSGDV